MPGPAVSTALSGANPFTLGQHSLLLASHPSSSRSQWRHRTRWLKLLRNSSSLINPALTGLEHSQIIKSRASQSPLSSSRRPLFEVLHIKGGRGQDKARDLTRPRRRKPCGAVVGLFCSDTLGIVGTVQVNHATDLSDGFLSFRNTLRGRSSLCMYSVSIGTKTSRKACRTNWLFPFSIGRCFGCTGSLSIPLQAWRCALQNSSPIRP